MLLAALAIAFAALAAVLALRLRSAVRRAAALEAEAKRLGVQSEERRSNVEALERAVDTLRASDAAHRSLLDGAPDWIWETDAEGVLTYSSPAGGELLGHAELVGRPLAEVTHPDDRPALAAEAGWSGVLRRRHADGSSRTTDVRSVRVPDQSGAPAGWRGIDRDLTAPPEREPGERPGVAIVRWPVVDGTRSVVGYELLGDGVLQRFDSAELLELGGGLPVWIDLADQDPPGLPPERVVFQLGPRTRPERARELAAAGWTLAVDDFDGPGPLLDHCAHVKVRVAGRDDEELRALIADPATRGLNLVATAVAAQDELTRCRVVGFSHFQGEFFTRPRGEAAGPRGGVSSLRALGELTSGGASFEDIERIIGADVGLSVALLRYVNSAFFALPREIDTVREALALLGTRAVRRWATVIALSAVSEAPDQLVALALLRGRMCELLGRGSTDAERDRLFTIGLLSAADALLDAPLDEILLTLPLSGEIRAALLEYEGRRGRVLATVLRYEQGHIPAGTDNDPSELADAYLAALRWADEAGRWVAQ
jgi:EAL and modified HD-GYP domain-containing signal transduction protein